jgi:hypothetical protein
VDRQISTREGEQESQEKLIIALDFSEALRINTAKLLGLEFFIDHEIKLKDN